MGEDSAGWVRLGRRIHRERAGRWRTRRYFAAATGLSESVLDDVENARRTNFSDDTIGAIESALGWRPGSAERVRADLDPEYWDDDPMLRRLRELWADLPMPARRMLLELAERAR